MESLLYTFLDNFPGLTAEEKDIIVAHSDIRNFNKGTHLLTEGETASKCYLILGGCVREYYIKDGHEFSAGFYTEGDPVNSFSSAITNTPSRVSLVCAEDCVLSVGDEDLVQKMCGLIPRLETVLRYEVERLTGKLQDDLAHFISSSPEERYIHLMKERPHLINRIPQHQIASYIGITPESLSRIRKRLTTKS